METNIRQAVAKARTVGLVSDIDLKYYKGDQEVSEDAADAIKGTVSVKTSDTNFVKYNVNVSRLTKAGDLSKSYPGIQTVMNTYKSVQKYGAEEADKIVVNGDINLYQSIQSGEEMVSYKSNFFNRVKDLDKYEPKAEFEIEMFIKSMVPEVSSEGDETGRVKINGVVPIYDNKVECVTVIAPAEDGIADAITSILDVGQTASFTGDIVNARVTKITEIPVAIGKPRQKTETSYVNELIITGVSQAYGEEPEDGLPAAYQTDVIKACLEERKQRFEERKNKKNGTPAKPSAASKGRSLGF